MAQVLAAAGIAAIFSYAGRTANPVSQPLPIRVGGFGGVAGLERTIAAERITHVVDATHPFAAGMSRNAIAACAATGTPLITFERAPWVPGEGDDWNCVPDIDAAVAALPETPARVFLAIGRQNLAAFAMKQQHFYLLRLVDAPQAPLPLARSETVLGRGPFKVAGDIFLLKMHGITHIVAKNSGGEGGRAKLDAARLLRLPVILIERPVMPEREIACSVEAVMRWLGHPPLPGAENLGV